MSNFICSTCGTQYADSVAPPDVCVICEDDRQYVGWGGQQWTTAAALAADHSIHIGDDAGVRGYDISPVFGIPQRMALVPTRAGNVLWESLSLVTDAAVADLQAQGGVAAIAISHPHFYTAMVDWSEALGGVPIWLHAADRQWVQRPAPQLRFWEGPVQELAEDARLIHCGGHFPGSCVLHVDAGPGGEAALFSGDTVQVAMDRRQVSFMHSYPNAIPLPATAVRSIQQRLAGHDFARVYGYSRGRNIIGNARRAVDDAFAAYLDITLASASQESAHV